MDSITTSPPDLLAASLEAVGETDIVPPYFARFFALFPEQEERFHNRGSSQGLMVNEMLSYLLAQSGGEGWVPTMMRAQVITHRDHGEIALAQYRRSLDLLVEVMAEAAGPAWRAEYTRAWQGEIDRLFALIERAY